MLIGPNLEVLDDDGGDDDYDNNNNNNNNNNNALNIFGFSREVNIP